MIYINFSAEINSNTSEALMNFLADQINKGEREFYILISSPGGSTTDGITLYNFINSLPGKVIMHNVGIIDSIANVIFLASKERYATPHSSFLFHGVAFNITQPGPLGEKELKEKKIIRHIYEEKLQNSENKIQWIENFLYCDAIDLSTSEGIKNA